MHEQGRVAAVDVDGAGLLPIPAADRVTSSAGIVTIATTATSAPAATVRRA
ncbi:hypothetical protein [Nonomuraea sp. B1E8]|uniref:hypothetical protein n=1 Tax=unclassified Nonomuraea TaxID=2593643 RepID=UPI00325C483E